MHTHAIFENLLLFYYKKIQVFESVSILKKVLFQAMLVTADDVKSCLACHCSDSDEMFVL